MRRRSRLSAMDPPINDPAISGVSWARLTNPTASDEWVSWNTW